MWNKNSKTFWGNQMNLLYLYNKTWLLRKDTVFYFFKKMCIMSSLKNWNLDGEFAIHVMF